MGSNFIKIGEDRLQLTTIKKYKPLGELKVKIYYNTSRYKIEAEEFTFDSTEERNIFVARLDFIFLM